MLDTHIVVWAALDPKALSVTDGRRRRAARPLGRGGLEITAEVAQLPHRRRPERSGESRLHRHVRHGDELGVPAADRHYAATNLAHSLEHKDPLDDLLLVQAQEEGMRLLTRDSKLNHHPSAVA